MYLQLPNGTIFLLSDRNYEIFHNHHTWMSFAGIFGASTLRAKKGTKSYKIGQILIEKSIRLWNFA